MRTITINENKLKVDNETYPDIKDIYIGSKTAGGTNRVRVPYIIIPKMGQVQLSTYIYIPRKFWKSGRYSVHFKNNNKWDLRSKNVIVRFDGKNYEANK